MVVDGSYYWKYLIVNCRAKGVCKHIIVHIRLYPLKINFAFFPVKVVDLQVLSHHCRLGWNFELRVGTS